MRAQWDPVGGDDPAREPRRPRPVREVRKQSRLGKFVATYGWRAYVVPVLVVVTVVVLWDAFRGTGDDGAAEEQSMVDAGEIVAEAPRADGLFPADLASGTLPDGGPFTERGAQRWRVLPGTTARVGSEAARTFTYTVEVEDGIDTAGYGGDDAFGLLVDQTLADPRSWVGDPQFAFRRIDVGTPDFRISLTSQMTIREGCGYDIRLEGSCFNPSLGRVLLNEARWVRGAVAFQGDLGSYRQYLVNHEVGHAIGFAQHERCGVQDGLAPIMMQQTFGTNNDDIARLDPGGVVPADGLRCRFNPWPYPRA
ncbi:DUF3152 domain-containing protein [Rhodococcus sp. DT1]|uniref:DUF3152 domain-containing protein n=1 Tax=unclassified Rhodococcus (in: high G+C Gram-positive bacteria) TaxID=192944 RepID=UPI001F0D4D39|nr:DUF3152 domain-containing protein [Rhodococcus sp. BL-253-APC-6A1W]